MGERSEWELWRCPQCGAEESTLPGALNVRCTYENHPDEGPVFMYRVAERSDRKRLVEEADDFALDGDWWWANASTLIEMARDSLRVRDELAALHRATRAYREDIDLYFKDGADADWLECVDARIGDAIASASAALEEAGQCSPG